jgi:hypothetical protein
MDTPRLLVVLRITPRKTWSGGFGSNLECLTSWKLLFQFIGSLLIAELAITSEPDTQWLAKSHTKPLSSGGDLESLNGLLKKILPSLDSHITYVSCLISGG